MPDNNYQIVKLIQKNQLKSFSCDEGDLNDFFYNEALLSIEKLLSVTYLFETNQDIIAFFSLLNDKITINDVDNKSQWKASLKKWELNRKKYHSFPAVKIGRLGVSKVYEKRGYGSQVLNFIKLLFITDNRTGCRFITVDAYNKPDKPGAIDFYLKNGFDFLNNKDKNNKTRLMYFDLSKLPPIKPHPILR